MKPAPTAGFKLGGMVHGIDHINIVVADLGRSVEFYAGLLGFTKTREACLEGEWIDRIAGLRGVRARVAYVVAPAGEPRIELLCYEAPKGEALAANACANTVGLRHLALRVDDMAGMIVRLRNSSTVRSAGNIDQAFFAPFGVETTLSSASSASAASS